MVTIKKCEGKLRRDRGAFLKVRRLNAGRRRRRLQHCRHAVEWLQPEAYCSLRYITLRHRLQAKLNLHSAGVLATSTAQELPKIVYQPLTFCMRGPNHLATCQIIWQHVLVSPVSYTTCPDLINVPCTQVPSVSRPVAGPKAVSFHF